MPSINNHKSLKSLGYHALVLSDEKVTKTTENTQTFTNHFSKS